MARKRDVTRRGLLQAGGAIAAAALPGKAAGEQAVGPVMAALSGYMSGAHDRALLDAVIEKTKHHVLDTFAAMTSGAVQTFFFRSEGGPWSQDRLAALAPVDAVIHLSRERILAKIYPGVDVLTSRSRLLETKAVGDEHADIAERVRRAIAALWAAGGQSNSDANPLMLERARKLQSYFGQPFYVAEPYTKRPGTTVSLAEALRTCGEILDGKHDGLPLDAFHFAGGIEDIRARAAS